MNSVKNSPRIVVLLACCLCIGCAENPGTWSQDKVQAKIVEKLELTDVVLTPKEGGGFEGTGMYGEETVSFTITQDPDAHRLSWDATGDRGLSDSGFYELK